MKYTAAAIYALTGAALLSSSALAADLYTAPPVYEPAAATPTANYFKGFYFGAHAGWGWAKADASYVDSYAFGYDTSTECGDYYPFGCAVDLDPDGGFIGGQVGYNFVFNNGLMLGVEGDYSFASLNDNGSETFGPWGPLDYEISDVDLEVDQMATVMVRAGWVMGRWMPFIAGGWGWAHAERDVTSSFPAQFTSSDSAWHDGWVVGAGTEFAINEHWTLKGEYRYFDGSNEVYSVGFAGGTQYDLDIHTVRFGINYNF